MEKIIVLILIIACLLIGWLISFFMMRRRYERQFADLSDAISRMINHKELTRNLETKDTLPSKTSHQLIRLQEIQLETERKMKMQQDIPEILPGQQGDKSGRIWNRSVSEPGDSAKTWRLHKSKKRKSGTYSIGIFTIGTLYLHYNMRIESFFVRTL